MVAGQFVTQALCNWKGLVECLGHQQINTELELNGHFYELETTPMVDRHSRFSGRLIMLHDITARKKAENESQARLRYEENLALCSQVLLDDLPDALTSALEILRRTADVSRVYIFTNFQDAQDGLCMRLISEADGQGVVSGLNNPFFQHLPYEGIFSRWRTLLSERRAVIGRTFELPQIEQDYLTPYHIQSILVLPLWVDGKWFGLIGFDELSRARNWSEENIQLLKTAAGMVESYLQREQAEAEIRQAKEAAETANHAKKHFPG